jgi:leucyl/phenylalanyl-tRNA--protein transferase
MSVMRFVRGVRAAGSLRWPVGFAGICTDLSVTGLRAAYASGLYPVCAIGLPALCTARERMVLFIENFHLEPAVRRRLRMKEFEFSLDRDFNAVIAACAADRPNRMSRELVEAFIAAHDAGIAHSVEVRDRSGALVGGIFGFAIGRVFFTEGQFVKAKDAGKAGFAVLNCHLQRWGYLLNDAKHLSGRLCQLGFSPIRRETFDAFLAVACAGSGHEGRWAIDQSLNLAAWNPRAASMLH